MPFGLLSKTLDARKRSILRGICLAAIVLAILSAVYHRAPISFLRAESGLYLWISQSGELMQNRFQQEFITRSYRGHWTPLAFLTEFWTTKLIGARGTLWHYRQLLLLTVLGLSSLAFVANMARSLGLRPEEQRGAALAICALLFFEPLMFEFVVWPFMGLQLVWMIFAMLACLSCVQLANDPNRITWIWGGAGAAYASLHVLGIGLAVTLATAGVFVFLTILSFRCDWIFKPTRRHLLLAGTLLILLSGGHCVAMALLLPPKTTASVPTLTLNDVKLGLEFLLRFVFAGLRSFTLTLHPIPNNYLLEPSDDWRHSPKHWLVSMLGCLAAACTVYTCCRRAFSRPSPKRVLRANIVLFCAIAVGLLVALIISRQIMSEREPYGMLPFYTAIPRYIIPLQIFLLGPVILLVASLARRAGTLFTYSCIAYALGALVLQIQFQRSPTALLTPQSRVSHKAAWKQLVEATRQCRAARLPLPNFSLIALTEEWPNTEVKMFVPLLQREVGAGPTEQLDLISAEDYRSSDRKAWEAAPGVAKFERLLQQAQPAK